MDGIITEFLLVLYFGACIHVPPPPANQTVLVTAAEGHGIRIEESYNPIWVLGTLIAEGSTTDLADAGYYVQNAIIEPYTYNPFSCFPHSPNHLAQAAQLQDTYRR